MSEFIGVVFDMNSRQLRLVIDPDHDAQLDDPAHVTCAGDRRAMLKVPRSESPLFAKGMSAAAPHYISQHAADYLSRL